MPEEKTRLIAFRLPPATFDALQRAAAADGRTVSNWLQRAVHEKLTAAGLVPTAEDLDAVRAGLAAVRRGDVTAAEEYERERLAVK